MRRTSSGLIRAAFVFMYLAWGATYLGVHYGLESIPPFILAGSRFLLAGSLLLGLIGLFQRRSFHWGNAKEWKDASIVGTLIPVMGNGVVAWAQTRVPSGLAALLFGSMPLWIIFFDWVRPEGTSPTRRTVAGLLLGLVGVGILVRQDPGSSRSTLMFLAEMALLLAACSWAAGGIYSRHVHARGSMLLPMSRQMIIGGRLLLLVSGATGEWKNFSLAAVTSDSWLGFSYLVVFGSLTGFTLYLWLMRNSTPAQVATIPYMNMLVAVLLGCAVLHEAITPRLIVGAITILVSVALVLKRKQNAAELASD